MTRRRRRSRAARAHAAGRGLRIDYRVGAGEELPVPDAAFGVACCCDVLEHVSDVDRVISETARVLKPGGLYLFDTINRTLESKLLAIKADAGVAADPRLPTWRSTTGTCSSRPPSWPRILARHGLVPGEMTGLGARAKPLAVLRSFMPAPGGGGSPTGSSAGDWTWGR